MDTGSRKAQLKTWRTAFREAVFGRDKNKCVTCGKPAVDAHHITDRNEIPNGGYVVENGISLCGPCHLNAEEFHASNGATHVEGFSPKDLYAKIGSSWDKAQEAAKRLDRRL